MAILLISVAIFLAHKLQRPDKVSQSLDTPGEINRLQGDYDSALLCNEEKFS